MISRTRTQPQPRVLSSTNSSSEECQQVSFTKLSDRLHLTYMAKGGATGQLFAIYVKSWPSSDFKGRRCRCHISAIRDRERSSQPTAPGQRGDRARQPLASKRLLKATREDPIIETRHSDEHALTRIQLAKISAILGESSNSACTTPDHHRAIRCQRDIDAVDEVRCIAKRPCRRVQDSPG